MNPTLNQIYSLRRDFIIIGLTGRTGSGCTTVANVLTEPFDNFKTQYHKKNDGEITNETRKDAIIYNFLNKGNWVPFEKITASDIIFLFLLRNSFESFKKLMTIEVTSETRRNEILNELDKLNDYYDKHNNTAKEVFDCLLKKTYTSAKKETLERYYKFLHVSIPEFRYQLSTELSKIDKRILTTELQKWGNNIRKYGSVDADNPDKEIMEYAPACLAMIINRIAKLIRHKHELEGNKSTRIVIDALRNPFEILYFRERFSAFYAISVTTDKQTRYDCLSEKGISKKEALRIDEKEKAKNDFSTSYQEIDVDRCIELSDIFLTHDGTPQSTNRHLRNQIAKYVALILHPGLVPPSPMERIMQVAYTAKLNSGCLSRQVGAAVVDEYFSVKAIGWNTVPEGQTPCSLRSLSDLVEDEDEKAYSDFERTNNDFRKFANNLRLAYNKKKDEDHNVSNMLKSIGTPYCFKDLYTTCFSKHKGNQVHTRSLHAEENAFLQLAKYGSQGIKGGRLFTTASCCELCGKKAYQLGIKEIYYIDSYPGITESHILKCGTQRPVMKLFHGAIGSAYIALYEPFIPLKDEIREISSINPKSPIDYTRTSEDKIKTEYYIEIKCDDVSNLKDTFHKDIKDGNVDTWELDKDDHITTTLDDKRRQCWFQMEVEDTSLKLYLIESKKFKCDDKLRAIFLGRICATLYANYQSFNFEFNVSHYFSGQIDASKVTDVKYNESINDA